MPDMKTDVEPERKNQPCGIQKDERPTSNIERPTFNEEAKPNIQSPSAGLP
jgi:hypothetical protein